MGDETVKEYQNGDLTVVWKPKKCIHSGICVQTLPQVYDPKAKPWIKAENASVDELKSQIARCPSGALSYYMADEEKEEKAVGETKVEVVEDGPLMVYGTLTVKDAQGKEEVKSKTTAFCRCGESKNKPYCDGTHQKVSFKG